MEGEMVFWLAVSAAAAAGAAAFLALRAAGILRGAARAEARRPSRLGKAAGRRTGRAARGGCAPAARAPVPVQAASPVLVGFRAPGRSLPFLLVSPVRDCERRFFLETTAAFPAFEVPFAAALRLPGEPGPGGLFPALFELAADPLQSPQLAEAALPEALGYGSRGFPMGSARGLADRLAYDAAGALLALARAPWQPLALRRASQLSREALSSGAQASGGISGVLRGLADSGSGAGEGGPSSARLPEGRTFLLQAVSVLERSPGADCPEPLLPLLDAALHALSERPRFAVRLDAAGRVSALYRFDASAGEGGDAP